MLSKKPKFFYQKCFLAKCLLPFSWLYLVVFFICNKRLFKNKAVCKTTICIGNIVVGGSGKTPVAITLGMQLSQHHDICYITKGYGRKNGKNFVIPKQHQELFQLNETGDEALLLNEIADVFVVNKRRQAQCKEYDIAICDDGFFDNSIKKDCQIAVFDSNFFVGNGYSLPAGPLRFSLQALKKADFVIITDADKEKLEEQMFFLQKYVDKTRILYTNIKVKSQHNIKKKYLAFAGIGENSKFFSTLKRCGFNIVGTCEFGDHIFYDKEKLNIIEQAVHDTECQRLITTSKDFVKLPQAFIQQNNVEVLEIEHEIIGIESILKFINDRMF